MTLDKFGRPSQRTILNSSKLKRKPNECNVFRNAEGDFEFDNKRLCKIGQPVEQEDASNKKYVDSCVEAIMKRLSEMETQMTVGWPINFSPHENSMRIDKINSNELK